MHERARQVRRVVAMATAITCSGASTALAAPGFGPTESYAVGTFPNGIEVADLNGDGKPDVVVPDSDADVVRVLLNSGTGTLQPAVAHPVGDFPYKVAFADVDGDGHLDVAVSNAESEDVSLLRGTGGGNLGPATPIATLPGAGPIGLGDVDADGRPDLVVASTGTDTLQVLSGGGDGTFTPGPVTPTGDHPSSLVLGDVDRDSDLDVVVSSLVAHTVSVHRQNGGGFISRVDHPVGQRPFTVDLVDLDGDRDRDIVTANSTSRDVSVLKNDGPGMFSSATAFPASSTTDFGSIGAAVGDLDGDGKPDALVSNNVAVTPSAYAGMLLGTGTGAFGAPLRLGLPDRTNDVAIADVDGDGRSDVLAVTPATGQLHVLRGRDTTPPDTTITSGPTGTIYSSSAAFGFTADEPGSTFECRLDSGPWQACTSPKSYSGFPAGAHTFAVRAKDAAENVDASPATRTFTYRSCLLLIPLPGSPICL